ncbi:unnamed protein product [Ceratitis capitata]|uniref:(Mediterranean fruit fly) hypothetical protein n=1 Tax=Ceratitis capitata TaxID=7213 RepID=A0A811U9M7_CERCA|nr:unnamed protein product [Ceratitis capitata]
MSTEKGTWQRQKSNKRKSSGKDAPNAFSVYTETWKTRLSDNHFKLFYQKIKSRRSFIKSPYYFLGHSLCTLKPAFMKLYLGSPLSESLVHFN